MNEKIKQYIINGINEKNLSHAFLIETNNCEKTINDIYKIFVENQVIPNKTIENNLSVKIVEPEKNNIDKNKILEIKKYITTKSQESDYKIYFISNAEMMNQSSSNTLLKTLEEPSDNVIAFIITGNSNKLLPTILSRVERFTNYYQTETTSDEPLIIDSLSFKNYEEFINIKKKLQTLEKQELIETLRKLGKKLLIESVTSDNINKILLIEKIINILENNGNIDLTLDRMYIELRNL